MQRTLWFSLLRASVVKHKEANSKMTYNISFCVSKKPFNLCNEDRLTPFIFKARLYFILFYFKKAEKFAHFSFLFLFSFINFINENEIFL